MYLRSEIHLKIHCVKTMELGISAIAVEQIEVKPMKNERYTYYIWNRSRKRYDTSYMVKEYIWLRAYVDCICV